MNKLMEAAHKTMDEMRDKAIEGFRNGHGKPYIDPVKHACLWDSFSEEDKAKPMMLSCPCPKCSSLSLG